MAAPVALTVASAAAGRPSVIPWLHNGNEPRFACDVMTEGLARQLRLCGLDAVSAPVVGKGQRFEAYRWPSHAAFAGFSMLQWALCWYEHAHTFTHSRLICHRYLVDVAERERRVILTSDTCFLRAR
jgi:hypothetical protein